MNITLYGTDVLATLNTDNESLVSVLDSLVSVSFEATFLNPFWERINEPTERGGGVLHNYRKARRTFSVTAYPIDLEGFQVFMDNVNLVMEKEYIYLKCEDYDAQIHATDHAIPIEILGEQYANTAGYKVYSFDANKKYL
jgi:hypothetical protein